MIYAKTEIDCKYFSLYQMASIANFFLIWFWFVSRGCQNAFRIKCTRCISIIFNSKQTSLKNDTKQSDPKTQSNPTPARKIHVERPLRFFVSLFKWFVFGNNLFWICCQFYRRAALNWYCFHLIIFKFLIKILEARDEHTHMQTNWLPGFKMLTLWQGQPYWVLLWYTIDIYIKRPVLLLFKYYDRNATARIQFMSEGHAIWSIFYVVIG